MSVQWLKIEPDNEVDKLLYKYCTNNYRKSWIEIGEDKICMPDRYANITDEINNFEVKDSDVYITSHPKAGTTWMQEMVWMIINNLNFEEALKNKLYFRVPYLEFQAIFEYDNNEFMETVQSHLLSSIELCKTYPYSPRLIKTHLPYNLLPKQIRDNTKKPKIIHVIRNPKDTCVSFYYHYRLLNAYKGNFDDFCKLFLTGRTLYSPFWKNVMSYWVRRNDSNILIVRYEDMKKNLASVIIQVANFLDRKLNSKQIALLEHHLDFKNMSRNKSVNFEDYCDVTGKLNNVDLKFMRSGTVGSYKAELGQNMIDIFDKWIKDNTKGTDLCFDEL